MQTVETTTSSPNSTNAVLCAAFRPFLSSSRKKLWIETGLYYGYPQCCIVNFCRRGFKLTKEQEAVHKNTGFTPCPKCSKKILNGEATLESLIANRVCRTKFPKDDWD